MLCHLLSRTPLSQLQAQSRRSSQLQQSTGFAAQSVVTSQRRGVQLQQQWQQQQHCTAAALHSTEHGEHGEEHAVTYPLQSDHDSLWSEEDIFDAFEGADDATAVDIETRVQPAHHLSTQVTLNDGHEQHYSEPSLVQSYHELQQQQRPQDYATALHQHSRHQQRFNKHVVANMLQQHLQQVTAQQLLQPVVRSFDYMHLLQRAAGVASWSAASAVLQEQGVNLHAEHIALLWARLTPKLQLQQKAAVARSLRKAAAQTATKQHVTRPSEQQPCVPANIPQLQQQQQRRERLQVQSFVLHRLCRLTAQFACSMGPQAVTVTLQGLAAAAAAGKITTPSTPAAPAGATLTDVDMQEYKHHPCGLATPAPALALALVSQVSVLSEAGSVPDVPCDLEADPGLISVLLEQLLQQAEHCSAEQIATCLASGQQLGWCSSSSNGYAECSAGVCAEVSWCWRVMQRAHQGQLGVSLQTGTMTPLAAAHLLCRLAACDCRHQLTLPPHLAHAIKQQSPPWPDTDTRALLLQLAGAACNLLSTHATTGGSIRADSGTHTPSAEELQAAVCSVEALAKLQVFPDPQHLEHLLEGLQPHIRSDLLPAHQLLLLLQSCNDLGVEPWPEWLGDCYDRLTRSLQDFNSQQLLLLMDIIQNLTNLQPSRHLLHQLAKLTAVHCSSYDLQQLSSLALGFKQLGFRPERYWLKDYLRATSSLLASPQHPPLHHHQQQQQCDLQVHGAQQQQEQPQEQQQGQAESLTPPSHPHGVAPPWSSSAVDHVVQVMLGAEWLSAAAPPSSWLQHVEQALLAAADFEEQQQQQHHHQQQQHSSTNSSGGVSQSQLPHLVQGDCLVGEQAGRVGCGRISADSAEQVAMVMSCWAHTPSSPLQQVLTNSLPQPNMVSLSVDGATDGSAGLPLLHQQPQQQQDRDEEQRQQQEQQQQQQHTDILHEPAGMRFTDSSSSIHLGLQLHPSHAGRSDTLQCSSSYPALLQEAQQWGGHVLQLWADADDTVSSSQAEVRDTLPAAVAMRLQEQHQQEGHQYHHHQNLYNSNSSQQLQKRRPQQARVGDVGDSMSVGTGQLHSRSLARSWYRSKLLQLLKSQKGMKPSKDAAVLVVS